MDMACSNPDELVFTTEELRGMSSIDSVFEAFILLVRASCLTVILAVLKPMSLWVFTMRVQQEVA
jgi:hypothetical protein